MFIQVDEGKIKYFKAEIVEIRGDLVMRRKKLEGALKELRKALKEVKDVDSIEKLERQVEQAKVKIKSLEHLQQPYNFPVTKTLPVAYGGYVFNYWMLKDIEKKLKGFDVEVTMQTGVLTIAYSRGLAAGGVYHIMPLGDSDGLSASLDLELVHVNIGA